MLFSSVLYSRIYSRVLCYYIYRDTVAYYTEGPSADVMDHDTKLSPSPYTDHRPHMSAMVQPPDAHSHSYPEQKQVHQVQPPDAHTYPEHKQSEGTLSFGVDITDRENAIKEIERLKRHLEEENIILKEEILHRALSCFVR